MTAEQALQYLLKYAEKKLEEIKRDQQNSRAQEWDTVMNVWYVANLWPSLHPAPLDTKTALADEVIDMTGAER